MSRGWEVRSETACTWVQSALARVVEPESAPPARHAAARFGGVCGRRARGHHATATGHTAANIAIHDGPAAAAPATEEDAAVEDEALGDLEDISLYDLRVPMVVTAARHRQPITAVPYAMSVITADDIRRSGANNVADALRLAPGVDVADLSYGQTAVSPRGFHGFVSRGALVLVDGRQIFDSFFGGTLFWHWPFQLEDIERIEVIRGPAGVTWGPNAVNGVINIITKKPKDQAGITYRAGGGSRGVWSQHLGYAFADEKLQLRFSAEYEASDGFERGGTWLGNLEDQYKGGRAGLHAIIEASPRDTVTISGGSSVVGWGFAPSPLRGFGMGQRPGSQANYFLTTWEHRVARDNVLQITTYVNDFASSPGAKQVDYRYQQLALLLSHSFKPHPDHHLTWGVDVRGDFLNTGLSDPFMLSHDRVQSAIVGLYLQDEWNFAPRWTLHLGGRIDYETYRGVHPSARAALSYQLRTIRCCTVPCRGQSSCSRRASCSSTCR